jgi:hypothetical protein
MTVNDLQWRFSVSYSFRQQVSQVLMMTRPGPLPLLIHDENNHLRDRESKEAQGN